MKKVFATLRRICQNTARIFRYADRIKVSEKLGARENPYCGIFYAA